MCIGRKDDAFFSLESVHGREWQEVEALVCFFPIKLIGNLTRVPSEDYRLILISKDCNTDTLYDITITIKYTVERKIVHLSIDDIGRRSTEIDSLLPPFSPALS